MKEVRHFIHGCGTQYSTPNNAYTAHSATDINCVDCLKTIIKKCEEFPINAKIAKEKLKLYEFKTDISNILA